MRFLGLGVIIAALLGVASASFAVPECYFETKYISAQGKAEVKPVAEKLAEENYWTAVDKKAAAYNCFTAAGEEAYTAGDPTINCRFNGWKYVCEATATFLCHQALIISESCSSEWEAEWSRDNQISDQQFFCECPVRAFDYHMKSYRNYGGEWCYIASASATCKLPE